jgi:hypothetical protein
VRRAAVIALVLLYGLSSASAAPLDLHGFLDVRGGVRTQTDETEKNESLGEIRLQLEKEYQGDLLTLTLRSDLLHDTVPGQKDLDIEKGTGWLDLREASALYGAGITDIKIGRQILTWGTGDLLFINDMFPKDWQSFFAGRDEEYLKAPSDAVFVSIFPEFANIDIAYTPRFDSDRYISGDRISYWNPSLESVAGRNALVDPVDRDEWLDDGETAIRISRNVSGFEAAVYGYYGFWKNPEGMDPSSMRPYFPELSVYGASMRGAIGGGVGNLELGYYDSREDSDGSDPLVPNDEFRFLIGYERELRRNLSCGIQYYLEHMCDYDEYLSGLQPGSSASDEDRQLLTLRLTQQAMNQNLMISLFVYVSPTDEDMYARPVMSYKASDQLSFTLGGNFFAGNEKYTFFGQFEDNSNVYAAGRYSF